MTFMLDKKVREELKCLHAYVPGTRVEEIKKKYGIERIVKLASNENPLGPSPKAIEAINKYSPLVNKYPDSNADDLKQKIASKFNLSKEQVVLGNGGEEIIRYICETFINKGDNVVVSDCSFGLHIKSSQLMGAICKIVPLKEDYCYDLKAFIKAIDDKTKIAFICNPNNPTSKILTKYELEELLRAIPKDVVVVLDEAYFEFARTKADYPNSIECMDKYPNLIILRTFSKVSGLAGMRVGYMFSSKQIAFEISKIKGVFNVGLLSQKAAEAALEDDIHIKNSVELNNQSIQLMKETFDELGIEYLDAGGNFIFVNFNLDSQELYETLLKKGVILRPGYLWNMETWMRISSGTIEDTRFMLDKIKEVMLEEV